jgi:hypothetical protein
MGLGRRFLLCSGATLVSTSPTISFRTGTVMAGKCTTAAFRVEAFLSLSLVVTPAVLTTGALRLALVPDYVSETDFPPLSVILYGLFFAVFVAAAILPMVLVWRSRARELVGYLEPLPTDGKPTPEFAQSRTRLEEFLHLDIGYLRSPITALGILAPVVTAAITALIPTSK